MKTNKLEWKIDMKTNELEWKIDKLHIKTDKRDENLTN